MHSDLKDEWLSEDVKKSNTPNIIAQNPRSVGLYYCPEAWLIESTVERPNQIEIVTFSSKALNDFTYVEDSNSTT